MVIVKIKGGLGNQFFQYATALNVAKKLDVELKLDLESILDSNCRYKYRLDKFNIFEERASIEEIKKLKNYSCNQLVFSIFKKIKFHCIYNKKTHIIENSFFNPDAEVINPRNINLYLDGWFGNPKYFESIKNILDNKLMLRTQSEKNNLLFHKKIVNTQSVAIHIRRGDYTINSFFGLLPLEYYHLAVDFIKKNIANPTFFVFSNDMQWVKENLTIDGEVYFMEENANNDFFTYTQGDFEDFNLMKSCKHHIIANSTFSWWSAYMSSNKYKIVVAPKVWYKDRRAQLIYENSDFIDRSWILL
jgi:hypothetical protein